MRDGHESDAVTEDSVTPQRFGQIRAVFEAALDRPEGERDADDAVLLGKVRAMLDAEKTGVAAGERETAAFSARATRR